MPETAAGRAMPIYCTGGCDTCRDYAREKGVPLIIMPPTDDMDSETAYAYGYGDGLDAPRPSGDEALRAAAQAVVDDCLGYVDFGAEVFASWPDPDNREAEAHLIALRAALTAPVSPSPDDERRAATADDRAWASGYAAGRAAALRESGS